MKRFPHLVFLHIAMVLTLSAASRVLAAEVGQGSVYSVIELTFTGPTQSPTDAPARDIDFWVKFQHESGAPTYQIHGFWDGDGAGGTTGNVFKVRFTPTQEGTWTLTEVFSNRSELNQEKQGDFVTATASALQGFWFPDIQSAGGRWFVRSDGSHPYIVGNTHYDFLSRPNGSEASASSIQSDINNNAIYFKKLRFCLQSFRGENTSGTLKTFFNSSGSQQNTEGGASGNGDRPNPAFFTHRVDVAVDQAFSSGLIADLILGGTRGDQVANNNAYLKYVAARYGAYPNVWFTIGQEWDEQASASQQVAVGNQLRSYLTYPTPMSTHGRGGWSSALNGTWNSHSIRQHKIGDLSQAADGMQADYQNNGAKPTVNDENGYDPGEATTAGVIEGITGSFAGGGYGTTGHKTASKKGGYFWGHAARGKSISEHPSIQGLKFLRDTIDNHISFWKMTPESSNSSIFSGASSNFRVLAWANNEYVLLSDASDSSVTANLPSGTWTAERYDVMTQTVTLLSNNASGSFSFSTPNSRASLTVFKKIGASDNTPPAAPVGIRVE